MSPEAFTAGKIAISIDDAQGLIASKTLDTQDLDFYVTVKPRRPGELSVRLDAPSNLLDAAKVKVEFSPLSLAKMTTVAMQPNGDAKNAQTIELGTTVYGADDGNSQEVQWFRFVAGARKLVYFVLETPDRDTAPGVDIFDSELMPYSIGTPGYAPEATQNFPGLTPFRTRIVERGATYYVRVAAKHPAFRLRTDVFDVPPQTDPQVAIKTGMEYLGNFGDVGRAPVRPVVNPFEVGLREWLAGDKKRAEQMLVERVPANVIDLAWKIAAYKIISGHATAGLVDELYHWQRGDGSFPVSFDKASPGSEVSTFQALYALALAGKDARADKTTQYTLAAQKTDGSWQDGFNTAVRNTQFAVMALNQLFPIPDAPPPLLAKARTEHLDELLADLDFAPETQTKRVLNESSWVLAREIAAEALGRAKDQDAISSLERALGDSSKLVQRAAAQALREMDAAPALAAALRSSNGRVRWGALRAFQQASRPLAEHSELLTEVRAALQDAVPQNRKLAAKALSQWNQ